MTPRRYQLGKRAQTTAANRAKVISAARSLFGTVGFQRVSMDAVAHAAGVGRTTVFEQFQSKTALFIDVADEMRQQAFHRQFEMAAGQALEVRLQSALHGAAELWSSELVLFRRLDGMALLEPSCGVSVENDVERRRSQVSTLARELVAAGRARSGVDEAQLAEVLGLLTSFAAYSQLRWGQAEVGTVGPRLDALLSGFLAPAVAR